MSGLFLSQPNQDDINYEGIFNGVNKTIPDLTLLDLAVTGGFVGIEEGKSVQVCIINLVVTTQGEFFGQKYKYNAKIFDMDASKRDLAMRNLGVLDAQAGFPMTNGQHEISTESIEQYWSGIAEARAEFGLMISTEDMQGNPHLDADGNPTTKEFNWIRGFGYLREKMVQAGQSGSEEKAAEPKQQTAATKPAQDPAITDDDIGF